MPFFLAIALSLSDATVGNPGIHAFATNAIFHDSDNAIRSEENVYGMS